MSFETSLNFGPQWLHQLSHNPTASLASIPPPKSNLVSKCNTAAEYCYDKEKMLTLFNPTSELPLILNPFPEISSYKVQQPLSMQVTSEDDKQMLALDTNNQLKLQNSANESKSSLLNVKIESTTNCQVNFEYNKMPSSHSSYFNDSFRGSSEVRSFLNSKNDWEKHENSNKFSLSISPEREVVQTRQHNGHSQLYQGDSMEKCYQRPDNGTCDYDSSKSFSDCYTDAGNQLSLRRGLHRTHGASQSILHTKSSSWGISRSTYYHKDVDAVEKRLPEWSTEANDSEGFFDSSGSFRSVSPQQLYIEQNDAPSKTWSLEKSSPTMYVKDDQSDKLQASNLEYIDGEIHNSCDNAIKLSMDISLEQAVQLHNTTCMDESKEFSTNHVQTFRYSSTLWSYKDLQNQVQGPFSSMDMDAWYNAKFFSMNLPLKRDCDSVFTSLGSFLEMYGTRVPFHRGASSPPPIDVENTDYQYHTNLMLNHLCLNPLTAHSHFMQEHELHRIGMEAASSTLSLASTRDNLCFDKTAVDTVSNERNSLLSNVWQQHLEQDFQFRLVAAASTTKQQQMEEEVAAQLAALLRRKKDDEAAATEALRLLRQNQQDQVALAEMRNANVDRQRRMREKHLAEHCSTDNTWDSVMGRSCWPNASSLATDVAASGAPNCAAMMERKVEWTKVEDDVKRDQVVCLNEFAVEVAPKWNDWESDISIVSHSKSIGKIMAVEEKLKEQKANVDKAAVPATENIVSVSPFNWAEKVQKNLPPPPLPSLIVPHCKARPAMSHRPATSKAHPKDKGSANGSKANCVLDELTCWCQLQLQGLSIVTHVDIPTLVELLRDLDSPFEVEDYIIQYLGDSNRIAQFAKDFLEKRRDFREDVVKKHQSSHRVATSSSSVNCSSTKVTPSTAPLIKQTTKKKNKRAQKVTENLLLLSS